MKLVITLENAGLDIETTLDQLPTLIEDFREAAAAMQSFQARMNRSVGQQRRHATNGRRKKTAAKES